MAVARLACDRRSEGAVGLSDEVELYQRTYTTLLRSSGETHLRVLEPSHRAIGSSLHPLAAQRRDRPRRLHLRDPPPARRDRRRPARRHGPAVRGAGQRRAAGRLVGRGRGAGAAAALVRRRGGHARGAAGQRLRPRRPAADARRLPDRVEQDPRAPARGRLAETVGDREPAPEECARLLGGSADDWGRLEESWGDRFGEQHAADRRASGWRCACGCSAARTPATRA